jgi:5-methylcytosine-specific restriction endonuclease McrA
MNQTSRDAQHNFVHLHPVHPKDNINSLPFQDDKTGQKHSPNKLKWDFTDHTIGNHSASESGNGI